MNQSQTGRRLPGLIALLCAALQAIAADEPRHVEREPLFFTGGSKTNATAQLLWIPAGPPRLASSDGTRVFEAGRDFTWQAGSRTLTLTAESRISFKTTAELYPPPNSPNSYRARRGTTNQWMLFGPGRVMHDLQTFASYTSREDWQRPRSTPAPDAQLGGLRTKLRARQPLKLVVLGDSISTGADASALANVAPRQPGYPDLVARGLARRFGAVVTLTNLSVGGMDSAWGTSRVERVIAEAPDLLIVAFGMNDASGRRKAEDFARLTRGIFEPVRAARPDCAVILVSSMTANAEWSHAAPDLYPTYAAALAKLTGPGVAFADVTAVWSAIAARKKHLDLTGNGLNHPNDYGHRLYADTILDVIGSKKEE